MAKKIEVGSRIGLLTIIEEPEPHYSWHFSKKLGRDTRYTSYKQKCACDCGNVVSVLVGNLVKGQSTSCGCAARKKTSERNRDRTKHGMSYSSEYRIWHGMLQRCHNPNDPAYSRYGGRGITVCDAWRSDFLLFFEHVGPRPDLLHSIDRVDNSRGYEPGNVRWATAKEQQNNCRRHKTILTDDSGRSMPLNDWATELGLSRSALQLRVKNGLTGADLFAPKSVA